MKTVRWASCAALFWCVTSAAESSSLCHFTAGPRSGTTQDYAPMAPLPVGTPCQDGAQSYGAVISSSKSNEESYGNGGRDDAETSTICLFTNGPRSGQSQDYAPMAALPVGAPCQDGARSFGTVISSSQPNGERVDVRHRGDAATSTICHFTNGPRSGQSQDYAPMAALPLGTPCQDGIASSGTVAARSEDRSVADSSEAIDHRSDVKSRTCKFWKGPRAGETHEMTSLKPMRIGSRCLDSEGNSGNIVSEYE